MDINQLIADLQEISQKNRISHYKRDRCAEAATALATFQAENEKLRADVVRFNDFLASYQNVLVPELRAELEQVKQERDVAVEYLRGQCRYCKRNLVCTSRKGPHSNCWEWRGPQKEDET